MLHELTEIKRLRNKLGINQKELASLAGVSQSLIAKIESGKIEPTYSKACKIIETLKELENKEEPKAKELMNKKVSFAKSESKVKEIIKVMKQKGISQMPVMKDKVVCGIISEKTILDSLVKGKSIENTKVKEVMGDCPPIISLETSQKIILEILRENSIILVTDKGEIKGLISKSDLLENI